MSNRHLAFLSKCSLPASPSQRSYAAKENERIAHQPAVISDGESMTNATSDGMSFEDFLEHAFAATQKFCDETARLGIPLAPLSASHLFRMGEEDRLHESMQQISDALAELTQERIMMPFPDLSLITRLNLPQSGRRWGLRRLIQSPQWAPSDAKAVQTFAVMLVVEHEAPIVWLAYHYGPGPAGAIRLRVKVTKKETHEAAVAETGWLFAAIAAISHPLNYVVEVAPQLTTREVHRKARPDGRLPSRKSPHFIVIDHEVLVGMRSNCTGSGPTVIPHHRRGHWRRLAEACVHAQALGKTQTWVRPAFVGDAQFSDARNRYRVLLDFPMTRSWPEGGGNDVRGPHPASPRGSGETRRP